MATGQPEMVESVFEQIGASGATACLGAAAGGALVAGLVVGAAPGSRQGRVARCAAVGLLAGATGALAVLGWRLVVARTSFHERLYGEAGAEQQEQGRLIAPAAHYEARGRSRYSAGDPMLREAVPPQGGGARRARWALMPPDRLDSVWNLAVLAAMFAALGLAAGAAWGWTMGPRRQAAPNVSDEASAEGEGVR